ncbi:MAG: AlpA family phage regulatory protein [Endomicrobium sp.]|jgi:predicted DNA-binding transcriptional regulator AlpA|nr:AlpA family phage regulatory protein [Endomicrobium sp.]
MSDRYIAITEVLKLISCSKSVWYDLVKKGKAPKPYTPFGNKSVRWKLNEIHKWIENTYENNSKINNP